MATLAAMLMVASCEGGAAMLVAGPDEQPAEPPPLEVTGGGGEPKPAQEVGSGQGSTPAEGSASNEGEPTRVAGSERPSRAEPAPAAPARGSSAEPGAPAAGEAPEALPPAGPPAAEPPVGDEPAAGEGEPADEPAEPDEDTTPSSGDEPASGDDPGGGEEPGSDDPGGGDEPGSEGPGGGDEPGSDEPAPVGSGSVGPGSGEIPAGLPDFHITVIGSSTANGIGASTGDFAWVTQLDEALSARVATTYSTSNLAVGGYKAAHLVPGSGAPGSVDEAIAEKPDLIVVALAGSNDIEPGFTTEQFMSQMALVRDAARAAGIPTFFMSPLPKSLGVGERELLAEWSERMAAEFAECWIPGTTKAYAPCYIDVFQALADPSLGLATAFDSGDGQHPNDLGHALLFDAVDAVVQPYVCTKTECR